MAITQNTYTGDGSTVLFSFTFEYIAESDIKITLDNTLTTEYTLANATTIQFNTAPANGVGIRIYRDTNIDTLSAEFFPGSAIKAEDLNTNFTQNLYVTQEVSNNAVQSDDSIPFVNDISMGGYKITNLATPVADTDAVNKLYVDTKVGTSGPPGYTNWSYTALGGETVLGTVGPVLEYQSGKEQIYLNGALQQRNVDYTPDPAGAKITFLVALTAGDNVMVRCVNYLAADPTASYNFTRWRKTYSTLPDPVTSIVGNSDSAEALNYTVNREQVFINGALLQRGVDYTTPNSTSISLTDPLILGDVVEVHSNNSI